MKVTSIWLLILLAVALTSSLADDDSDEPPATTLFNLNSRAEEDFLTIPGVGERMAHEFVEYRPYLSIRQFRREMGKYVDETQIAAYEAHVYVPVDVNEADTATLMQLPCVDEAIATALAGARPFDTRADFLDLLGEQLAARDAALAQHWLMEEEDEPQPPFTLFNLNSRAEEDFLTIPGVGERMAHEFVEYRPYLSIRQFRREMGKYVDETQIAAYEAHVYVPVDVNEADTATLMQLPCVDEAIATALAGARPFDTRADFLDLLGEQLAARDAALAQHWLKEDPA